MKKILSRNQLNEELKELAPKCADKPATVLKSSGGLLYGMLQQYGYKEAAETYEELLDKCLVTIKELPARKKVKPGHGKQKGAAFEREICQQLSEWLSEGEVKDLFWRSAMSGGRATVMYKKGEMAANQSSDITAIAAKGECLTSLFCVECKFYKDLALEGLFFNRKVGITAFWKQVQEDANKFSKLPMLVAKQNNKPVLLGLNTKGYDLFCEGNAMPMVAKIIPHDLLLIEFEEFKQYADPNILIDL